MNCGRRKWAIRDCTPFTPQGHRGILNGQPSGDTGAPVAYAIDFGSPLSVNQMPILGQLYENHALVDVGRIQPDRRLGADRHTLRGVVRDRQQSSRSLLGIEA